MIIDRMYIWLLTFGAVLLVLFGMYKAGGRAVARTVELRQARRLADRQNIARGASNETNKMSDSDLRDAASQWVRGHTGR